MPFVSHKDCNLVQMFNLMNKREFYSNCDYKRVGGDQNVIQSYLDKLYQQEADKLKVITNDDQLF